MVVFTTVALAVLLAVAVLGGILAGFGAPGGVPVITTLYLTTDLSPASIAGTSSAVFTAASLTATYLYARSDDLNTQYLIPLVPTTLIGTQVGVYLNQFLPRDLFGAVIAILLLCVGPYIIYREYSDISAKYTLNPDTWRGRIILAVIGGFVGTIGGLTGVGGLTITVPLLLLLGVPVLVSVATAIGQSVFVTSATTIGYTLSGAVDFELALVLGLPFVTAQIIGWQFAHRIKTERLTILLGIVLMTFGIYLLIG